MRRSPGGAAREVARASRSAAARPWLERVARAGFASRAVLYAVIGGLALAVAAGAGGRTTDSKGALAALAAGPLGRVVLPAVALGLAALALWFAIEAIVGRVADPERWRRVATRIGRTAAGAGYGVLSFWAFRLVAGAGIGRHGDAAARSWTARALALPTGPVLVALVGVVIAAVGGHQVWRGVRRSFRGELDLARMSPGLRRFCVRAGVAGLVAQGTVIALVGAFLVQAGIEREPREATGLDGALAALAHNPAGAALLGAAALGLLAYAAFTAIEARYHKLPR